MGVPVHTEHKRKTRNSPESEDAHTDSGTLAGISQSGLSVF